MAVSKEPEQNTYEKFKAWFKRQSETVKIAVSAGIGFVVGAFLF